MAAAAKKNTLVFRSRTTMRSLLIMDRNDPHHKIPCHDCDKVRQGDIQDTLKDLVSRICVLEKGVLNMIELNELPGGLVSQATHFAGRGKV